MKRLTSIIIIIFFASSLFASPADSLAKGNELYKAEKYQQAVNTYNRILASGVESAALYFNLGNAYYKAGSLPNALLNFERAKLLAPNDENIQFNIDLCNQFVVDKMDPLPKPFFVKWLSGLIKINNADQWGYYSLISFVLMLAVAATYLLSGNPRLKKIAFSSAIVFLLLSVTAFGFASKEKSAVTKRNSAIIFSPTVTVKSSPDESGTSLFVIHEGLKVSIVESVSGWYEIKIPDGNSGWVKKEVLEKI